MQNLRLIHVGEGRRFLDIISTIKLVIKTNMYRGQRQNWVQLHCNWCNCVINHNYTVIGIVIGSDGLGVIVIVIGIRVLCN